MSLNLNDLRLFFEIVENRGILRAARALGLPKSTISRRLSGLEGLCCTNRVTDRAPLSPDGLIPRLLLRVCRAR